MQENVRKNLQRETYTKIKTKEIKHTTSYKILLH